MNMDIFVGIMCAAFVMVGIWAWWIERGGPDKNVGSDEKTDHSTGKDDNNA